MTTIRAGSVIEVVRSGDCRKVRVLTPQHDGLAEPMPRLLFRRPVQALLPYLNQLAFRKREGGELVGRGEADHGATPERSRDALDGAADFDLPPTRGCEEIRR